jgi:DNA-binding CsgD family transcriptional regulator
VTARRPRVPPRPGPSRPALRSGATGRRPRRRDGPGCGQPQRPHRRGEHELGRLTPQELQIARLLGSGRTTRQAAAALFLSPKPVEYHLRHVYSKLGISSRPELAARLEGRAPGP